MATSNFSYEHRCVVVTDNDYECDNVPPLGEYVNNAYYHNRTTTREVLTNEQFYFHKIVLTAGYYEAACIDYDSIEKITGYRSTCEQELDYFDAQSKRDLYHRFFASSSWYGNVGQKYGLTKYRFDKLTKGLDLYKAGEAVIDYLKKQEEALINKVIDRLKEVFGYEEYTRYATFSNGETIYKLKVS